MKVRSWIVLKSYIWHLGISRHNISNQSQNTWSASDQVQVNRWSLTIISTKCHVNVFAWLDLTHPVSFIKIWKNCVSSNEKIRKYSFKDSEWFLASVQDPLRVAFATERQAKWVASIVNIIIRWVTKRFYQAANVIAGCPIIKNPKENLYRPVMAALVVVHVKTSSYWLPKYLVGHARVRWQQSVVRLPQTRCNRWIW